MIPAEKNAGGPPAKAALHASSIPTTRGGNREPRPSNGPLITALLSTILCSGLIVTLKAGMPLNLITSLSILIPGMTFGTLLIAFSMGWIFVSLGRYHIQPRRVPLTAVLITITMLELLWLTWLANEGGKMQ